ncbi:hypothetical protein AB4400_31255, partial [Vibrio sp. 10N.261.48.A2]
ELPEFGEEDALAEADAEVTTESDVPVVDAQLDPESESTPELQAEVEHQAETAPKVEETKQAEILGQEGEDEFSFDDLELPEFG